MSRSLQFDVTAQDSASREFATIATAAERLEDKLKRLDRLRVEPSVQLNITPATRSAAQLQSRLEALRNVRATVAIDGAAEARRDVTALVVEMRKLRNARVRVDVDGDGVSKIAALATSLRTLTRDVKVKVGLDDGTFARDIARLHQRVSALRGTTVRINFDLQPPGIQAELASIAASLRALRGTTRHRVDVDTNSATAALGALSASSVKSAAKMLALGSAALYAIPALGSMTASAASLGGSLVSLTGLLGLLPAAGAVAAAGIGTVVVGLQGFGEAMKVRDDAEKFAEALKDLSPAAREVAVQVRDLGPAWKGLRLDVQEQLFRDLTDTIGGLSSTYLPVLKTGLTGIATELNTGAEGFAAWAQSAPAVANLTTILGNTRTTMRELAPAGTNVAAALSTIAVVGSGIMPELAAGARDATGRFREFVAEARQTGELEQWIRGGMDTLAQLGSVAKNTGSILGSVFTAAEAAGADFLTTVDRVTEGVAKFLRSTEGQSAMVDFFTESRAAIDAVLPGLATLGRAALDAVQAFANTGGLVAFGGAVTSLADRIGPLGSQLGELAGGTLRNLSNGAQVAGAALQPLISGISGVLDFLGPVVPLAVAAVIAFKGFALLTPIIAGVAGAAGVAAAAFTAMFATMGVAAGVGAAVTGAVLGFARALPLIGAAAIGVGVAMDAFSVSTNDAATVMAAGGLAAENMTQKLRDQAGASDTGIGWMNRLNVAVNEWIYSTFTGIATVDSATEAAARQRAEMTALERAQQDATTAQNDYQVAVDETGATSQRSRQAAADLADATDRVEAAQRRAEEATKSYSDKLRDQVGAAQSALGANLDLEAAVRAVADAETAANDAIREHGVESREAAVATEDLTRRAMDLAESAKQVAINQAEAAGSTDAAAAGEAAYAASLLNTAATLDGPARDAVLGQIAALSDAEIQALSAASAATGFATQILTLPDGRTVTIAVDPETGKIVDTQTLLDGMQDADVAVNMETQQAIVDFEGLLSVVNTSTAQVSINGNTQPAGDALATVLGLIAQGVSTVTINGNPMPTQQALSTILGQIAASGATVTINGQAVPAATVLSNTLSAIAAGQATVTINGQSFPAQAVLGAILGKVGGSSSSMTINGRDLASAVLAAIPKTSTHTVYIRTSGGVSRGLGQKVIPARAEGAYAIAAYAGGGFRSMTSGRAEIVPPRQPRLIGDRMQGDEAFIPINRSPRSMSILSTSAARMGFDLIPRNTSETLSVQRGESSSGPVARQVMSAMGQARGSGGPVVVAAPVDLRPLAAELRTFVQAALGRSDQAAVVAAVDRLGRALVAPQVMSAGAHRLAGADGAW